MTREQQRIEDAMEAFFGKAMTTRADGDLYLGTIELVRTDGSIRILHSDDTDARIVNISQLARELAP